MGKLYYNIRASFCLCVAFLSLCANNLDAQSQLEKQLTAFNKTLPQEKIHIHTDRTFYKPGQSIWFSVYLLNQELKQSTSSKHIRAELIAPSGSISNSILLEYDTSSGSVQGDFLIDNDDNGGLYKIRVYSDWMEQLGADNYIEKEINIQEVVYSNVLMTLDFERESYGPSSEVGAKLNIRGLNNNPLINKKIAAVIFIAGKKWTSFNTITDRKGNALVRFKLPSKLKSSDGIITFRLEHEEVVESISRSIPLLLSNIAIQFLPEGGVFAMETTQKMAFIATDEFGKPADIEGVILLDGDTITDFKSYHQGMGSFDLTAKNQEEHYIAYITAPAGIKKAYPIMVDIEPNAIGLRLMKNSKLNTSKLTSQGKDSLTFSVCSPINQELVLTVQMQGKLYYQQELFATQGENLVLIPIAKMPIGIAQVTVFDANRNPHAERLVFINKHKQLHVSIKPNKEKYLPKEEVSLEIEVRDQDSIPVQGRFSMAVIDEKNISLADDKQDNILSQILMTSDLKGEIYEPKFYFDPKEPKADTALDYVMLTHGWRRFEWKSMLQESPKDWKQRLRILNKQCLVRGIALVNGVPLRNKLVFIGENYSGYTKETAQAWARTDRKGAFKLENEKLTFPSYLSTRFRGISTNAYVSAAITGVYDGDKIESDVRDYASSIDLRRRSYDDYSSYSSNRRSSRRRSRAGGGRTGVTYEAYDLSGYSGAGSSHTSTVDSDVSNQVYGKVIQEDIEEGLPFANVVLMQNNEFKAGAQTDFDGNYLLSGVKAGAYQLKVSFIGYSSYTIDVVIQEQQGLRVDVSMEEEMVLLSSVEIDGKKKKHGVVTVTASQPIWPAGSSMRTESLSAANFAQRSLGAVNRRSLALIQQSAPTSSEEGETAVPRTVRRLPKVKKIREINKTTYSNNRYNFQHGPETWRASAEISFEIQEVKALSYYKARQFYKPNYGKSNRNRYSYSSDLRETIYWNPTIQTDSAGKAMVSYYNSQAITSFRATLEGFGGASIGRKEVLYHTQKNLELKSKVPNQLIARDTIRIPVIVKNNSQDSLEGTIKVVLNGQKVYSSSEKLLIKPDSSICEYIELQIDNEQTKIADLSIVFYSNEKTEYSNHKIKILPKGYPYEYSFSGNEVEQEVTFTIKEIEDASLNTRFYANPNPLDDMVESINGILRQPYGCFEQVSASNYPNVLALQYMEEMGAVDPERRATALAYLETGYKKLVAYETAEGGFEWYGATPPHLGLTAHGLLQFHDMKSVYDGVSQEMLDRVQEWVVGTRDGNGGFFQEGGKYAFSNKNKAVTNAYVVYALSQLQETRIEAELDRATEEALRSKDLYRLGLLILAHVNYKNKDVAKELWANYENQLNVKKLDKVTAETSITNSRGEAMNIEVLSIGALAMMKMKMFNKPLLNNIISYIASKRRYGRFGSTQSTIWALKAIIEFQKHNKRNGAEGEYIIAINGKEVEKVSYSAYQNRNIDLDNLGEHLQKGENTIKITCNSKKGAIPVYSLDANWFEMLPNTDTACLVEVNTSLAQAIVKMGETVRLTATLENTSDEAQASTIAIIGIPSGLSLQAWQLKELKEKNKVDYIELMDEYIVLHYRDMEPKEQHIINLDLKTEFAGTYQAPASVAYLYYNDEHKHWSDGTHIKIEN